MFDPHNPDGNGESRITEDETLIGTLPELVVACIMMAIYILVETFQHYKHYKFGHAAGGILVLGILTSVIIFKCGYLLNEFSAIALFDYAIPIILYNDGYNMRKQRFFKELSNICVHGILTTFVGIAITVTAIHFILKIDLVRKSFNFNQDEKIW